MPSIRVDMFEGRTHEQKRALAKELTDACVRAIGVSPESVDILFFDIPKQHWASGGKLWSDKLAVAKPPEAVNAVSGTQALGHSAVSDPMA